MTNLQGQPDNMEVEDLYGSIMTGDQLDFGEEPEAQIPTQEPLPVKGPIMRTAIDKDENNCLYINGLSWWITEEDLRDALEGRIMTLRIIFLESKHNGKSRGIAIMEFLDKGACEKAHSIISASYHTSSMVSNY